MAELAQPTCSLSSFRNVNLSVKRLKILWSPTEGLSFLKMPKIWVGRTTLNGEKKGMALSDSNNYRSRDTAVLMGDPIFVDQVKKSSRLSSQPNSIVFFAQVNITCKAEVRARVHVGGNFTHAQMAFLANSYSVTHVVRWKKCETFS